MKLYKDLYNESVWHLLVLYANIGVILYLLSTWRSSSPTRDRIRVVFLFFNLWMQFMWVCNGNECFLIVWEKQRIVPEYTKGQCPGLWPMGPAENGKVSVIGILFEIAFLGVLLFDFDEAPMQLRMILATLSAVFYIRRIRNEKDQSWMRDSVCQKVIATMDAMWETK